MTFLVYEHWRPDLNACFYVGKGKLKRSRQFRRNEHYNRIVKKLGRLGLAVEVRIIAEGLTEAAAFKIERDRIAFWRSRSDALANKTDGGDGSSGYQFTPEQKQKIRVKATGRKLSIVTRQKMGAARRGSKRSPETRERMRQAALRVQSESRSRVCATDKGRQRMQEMSQTTARDPRVRKVRSINAKTLWSNPAYREKVLAARCVSRAVVKGYG